MNLEIVSKTLFYHLLIFQYSFGQAFIKLKSQVVDCLQKESTQWLFRIKKLIALVLKQLCLSMKNESNSPVAIPLRLIEVFTTLDTYCALRDVQQCQQILASLWCFLVKNHYFAHLRQIFDTKVPKPYEETVKSFSPVAESLFNLVLRPLDLDGSCSASINPTIVVKFFEEFLRGPLSPQVQLQFIPKILHQIPASLTPASILSSILLESSNSPIHEGDLYELACPGDLWLLYSLLALISPQLHLMTNQDKFKYLIVLQELCQYLPDEADKQTSEDFEDESDVMEGIDEYESEQMEEIVARILELINEPHNVNCLISLVNHPVPPKNALIALSSVCHALISCHKFALHRFR